MKILFIILKCECSPGYAPLWFKLVFGGILVGGFLFFRWYAKGQPVDKWKIEQEKKAKAFAAESEQWYAEINRRLSNIPMDWKTREDLQLKIEKAIAA